jgi:hypothetical protein
MIISMLVIAKPVVPLSDKTDNTPLSLLPHSYDSPQVVPYSQSQFIPDAKEVIANLSSSQIFESDSLLNVTTSYHSVGGQNGALRIFPEFLTEVFLCQSWLLSCELIGYLLTSGNLESLAGLEFSPGLANSSINITLLYNDTATHSLPSMLTWLLNSVYALPADTVTSFTTQPWAYSDGISFDSTVFTTVLLMAIALTVAPVRSEFAFYRSTDSWKCIPKALLTTQWSRVVLQSS